MSLKSLTVVKIKELLSREEVTEEIIQELITDSRSAVRQLYGSYMKRKEAWLEELDRLRKLNKYEMDLLQRGYRHVAGTDEAGRGPLAGPVVAAAVILPPDVLLPGLNDSKKVAPVKRAELALQIKEKAVAWHVAISVVEEIDRINILQASLQAMHRAVESLSVKADFLLADAVTVPGLKIPQLPIIRGDSLSASIAAASILAKVTRDELMAAYDEEYPQYGFDKHKGYGTADHIEAIRVYGPCPLHRRTFLKSILD